MIAPEPMSPPVHPARTVGYAAIGVLLIVAVVFGSTRMNLAETTEVRELRRAATAGAPDAMNALADMYDRGQLQSDDITVAAQLYRRAADRGHAEAQANLGRIYGVGHGVDQDYAAAVYWYRKAAEQGNAAGQARLGEAYHDGRGVPQDFAEAVRWFTRAAEQGNASAQFRLGESYRDGEGIGQDLVQAHRWMNIAASHTPDDDMTPLSFARGRDEVGKKMSPEQVVEAQRLAREWVDAFTRRVPPVVAAR
jgi:uncharacterized protein